MLWIELTNDVYRCHDYDLLEGLVKDANLTTLNDFSIRRWLDDGLNLALMSSNGDCALFEYLGNNVYSGHYLFGTRGKEALESAKDFLKVMFYGYLTHVIVGFVPIEKKHVHLFSRWLGFKDEGETDTLFGKNRLFTLTRKDFING